VGFLWTMALLTPTVTNIVMGFFLFRLFDIVKPPPIRLLERKIKGGLGIVIDDLAAAVYTRLAIELIRRLWIN